MLPSLDENRHKKILRYQMIPSREIVNPRILQSDWTRGAFDHIQLELITSDATFP